MLHQLLDQSLHAGLVELNWLRFLEHKQWPRIAGQLNAAVEKLSDDVVEPPVLHRECDRGINRVDVGGEPRCLPAEKYVLKLHLRHGFATMEDEVGGRVRRDAGCDRVRVRLRPAVFGITIVAALDRRAWTSLDPHQSGRVGGLDHF